MHEAIRARVEAEGLYAFIRSFWHEAGEAVELVPEPHMELVCRHLEALALGSTVSLKPDLSKLKWTVNRPCEWRVRPDDDPIEPGALYLTSGVPQTIKNLVIAISPGSSKSKLCSVFLPAWVWTWAPGTKFICTSYAEDLVVDFGRQTFDVVRSEKYRACWPGVEVVDGDRAAMGDFRNSKGGRRWAIPMGGRVTGKHAHILLSDDPIKPDDLKLGGDSAKAALAQVQYRWDALFSNRSAHAPSFGRLVIAQRLHIEDLSGHFVRQGAVHLKVPMEFKPKDKYESVWGSDWRTEEGQLMSPKRFPQEVIDQRKRVTPPRDWAAQYDQNPVPEDGAIFERAWFRNRYTGTPWGNSPIVLTVDSANKETKESDYFVCQAWAKYQGKYWLVDQIRKRCGFSEQVVAIQAMRSRWANVKQILIEEKSNGTAIIDTLRKRVPGVVAINPEGGKEARMNACTWLWSTDSVMLPEGAPWLEEFINEHLTAPVGSHDDQVDAASQLLNWWSKSERKSLFKKAMAAVRGESTQARSISLASKIRVM